MPYSIDPALRVDQITVLWPATLPVLVAAGIEACCGGGVPLAEAAARDGVELEPLLAELEAVVRNSARPAVGS